MTVLTITTGSEFTNVNVYRNRLGLESLEEVLWPATLDSSKEHAAAVALKDLVWATFPSISSHDRGLLCKHLSSCHFEWRVKGGSVGSIIIAGLPNLEFSGKNSLLTSAMKAPFLEKLVNKLAPKNLLTLNLKDGEIFDEVNKYRSRLGLEVLKNVVWDNTLEHSSMSCAIMALEEEVDNFFPTMPKSDQRLVCTAIAGSCFGNLEPGDTNKTMIMKELSMADFECVYSFSRVCDSLIGLADLPDELVTPK